MIEEPYRWVEAIANRREYIETQLAPGSSIAAISYRDGVLLLTAGKARPKIFEIYDRIALGAIGHPGDIERLRLAAIELASTEGFTRSAADVSLRRLAYYSLSPAMKAAFEQVYGAPYLARLLFAEVGAVAANDLFLRMEYDGAIETNGESFAQVRQHFAVLSGTSESTKLMESFLQNEQNADMPLEGALRAATSACRIGRMSLGEDGVREIPTREQMKAFRNGELGKSGVEAAVLERSTALAIRYRLLNDSEINSAIGD